jgi:hypothetical protein
MKFYLPFLQDEAGDGSGSGGAAATSGDGAASSASAAAATAASSLSTDGTAGAGAGQSSASWLKPDYTFEDGWQNSLPDDKFGDLKPTLANFRDFPSLAKSLKESMTAARARTDGMVKLPVPPAANAKPETQAAYAAELAAFNKALGVPEKPEDYGLKAPDKMPDGVTWNEGHAKEFAGLAHKIGLNPSQVKALHDFQMGLTTQSYQDFQKQQQEHEAAQDKEIMEAFGAQADRKMIDVQRAAATFSPTGKVPETRAEMFKMLAAVTAGMSEDKLISSAQVTNKLGPEAMATEEMHSEAYRNPGHPRHKEAVARVNTLMQQAYPN